MTKWKRIKFTSGPVVSSIDVPEGDVDGLLANVRKAWSGSGPTCQVLTDEKTTTLINLTRVDTVYVEDARRF